MAETGTLQISDKSEPSVSTMLMNFANDFDPYDALSTPLYQTATFKQVSLRIFFGSICKIKKNIKFISSYFVFLP